jgi:hypothetical protein
MEGKEEGEERKSEETEGEKRKGGLGVKQREWGGRRMDCKRKHAFGK